MPRSCLRVGLIGLFLSAFLMLKGQGWSHLPGPEGAALRQFDTDGALLYALTSGGLYISADGGDHWELEAGTGAAAQRAHQFQAEAGVWYVLTWDRTLERSTDRGASWEVVLEALPPLSGSQESLLRVFARGNTVLVGSSFYLYRSGDRGSTWERTIAIDTDRFLPFRSLGVDLFATYENTILRSADDGLSWEPVFTAGYALAALSVVDTVLYGLYDGFPFFIVSPDRGANWEVRSMDPVFFGAYHEDFPDVITGYGDSLFYFSDYGCYHGDIIAFVSADRGVTWQFDTLTGLQTKALRDVHVVDNHLLMATHQGLFRSTNDTAAAYEPWGNGFKSTNVYEILRTGATEWWVTTGQGIYTSADDGATWALRLGGPRDFPCLTSLPVLDVTGQRMFYHDQLENKLYYSADRGNTWTPVLDLPVDEFFSSWCTTGATAWIQTTDRLLRWDDAAPGAVPVSAPGDADEFGWSKKIQSAGDGLFLSWQQKQYVSFDAGQTWEMIPDVPDPSIAPVFHLTKRFCTRETLVVSAGLEQLFRYSFADKQWSPYAPVDGTTGDSLREIALYHQAAELCWLGTESGSFYIAAEPTGPWFPFTVTTPFVRPNALHADANAVWVGTKGEGVFALTDFPLPNPAAPQTQWTIFPTPSPGPATLEASRLLVAGPLVDIYDAAGRQLFSGQLEPGFRWDLSGIVRSTGVYFVVIQEGTSRHTLPWMLLRE